MCVGRASSYSHVLLLPPLFAAAASFGASAGSFAAAAQLLLVCCCCTAAIVWRAGPQTLFVGGAVAGPLIVVALCVQTILISIPLANGEVGVVQPIREVCSREQMPILYLSADVYLYL